MKETDDMSVQNTVAETERAKTNKLLGFRTNKTWKKVLSILYLVFCILFVIVAIAEKRKGQITVYDCWVDKAEWFVLLLAIFSPYIFLSDTKLRNKLPLFKKHTTGSSIGGMMIVLASLIMIYGFVYSAHSAEYKADMKNHTYVAVSSKDATCENDGEILKCCEYCGKEMTETVVKLGHSMVAVTQKEATEKEEGQIVNRCTICGKEETVILKKLAQNELSSNNNATEVTVCEATAKTSAEPSTEFEWKPAIGNLYKDVELYIVTEEKCFLYGIVTEYNSSAHKVQVYLVEGETFMWFPTREISYLTKLKVRSDDPHLPENK